MKKIDREYISSLPVHDSDLLGIDISQNLNGDTDLLLHIKLYEGEYEDLQEYPDIISHDGSVSILFRNCDRINLDAICNRTQRDSVDYFQFTETPQIPAENIPNRELSTVKVVFISGSKLKCVFEDLFITNSKTE